MKISYIPFKVNEMNDVPFFKKYDYGWSNYLKHLLESNGHEIHTYEELYDLLINFSDYHVPRIIEIISYDLLLKGIDVDYNLRF